MNGSMKAQKKGRKRVGKERKEKEKEEGQTIGFIKEKNPQYIITNNGVPIHKKKLNLLLYC
jgi:SepF-like predicted cell division protein (DUF552 family)